MLAIIITLVFAIIVGISPDLSWLLIIFPGLYVAYAVFISHSKVPELKDELRLTTAERAAWRKYYAFIRYPSAAQSMAKALSGIAFISLILGVILLARDSFDGVILLVVALWLFFGKMISRLNPTTSVGHAANKGNPDAIKEVAALQSLQEKLQNQPIVQPKHELSDKEQKDYLLNKYSYLFDKDGKPQKDNKDIKLYAATLDGVAYRAVEDLHNTHHIMVSSDKVSVSVTTIAQFCIIMLSRYLMAKEPKERIEEIIDSVLKNLAKLWAKSDEHEQRMYELLQRDTKKTLTMYGDLPVSNQSGKQGGTLLWEYGKHLAKTVGKDPSNDPEALFACVSVITNANDKMKESTNSLINSLK